MEDLGKEDEVRWVKVGEDGSIEVFFKDNFGILELFRGKGSECNFNI